MKCKRCGRCCHEEVCKVGEEIYKTSLAPCPGLKSRGKIFSCELMEICSSDLKWFLFLKMGVGMGCDATYE